MSKIKFIYFDLGNVILNFDHAIAFQSAAEFAGVTPEQVEDVLTAQGLQIEYETGLLDCTQFHQKFCELTSSNPAWPDLQKAISDIFSVNRPMVPVLAQLKARGFPIGILSNTCDAHWQFVVKRHTILQAFFEPVILSYEEKSMKPDSKIYEAAIAKASVDPAEIFFTDDRQENVDGAIAAGMDATLFTTVPNFVQQLSDRGVECNW